MKIKEVMKNGTLRLQQNQIEDAFFKAKILLTYELKIPYEKLIIYGEEEINQVVLKKFEKDIEELINGKPIQYITNSQAFYGLNFYVDNQVLIPQPDTEILVEEVIEFISQMQNMPKILDICTGSGAIAISFAKNIKAEITASDISKKALEVAQKNAWNHKVKVKFIESNLFEEIKGKFDVIVSNPPYIETQAIKMLSQEVRHEPIIALDGGKDGCKFYRILAQKSKEYLICGGILAVEIGYNQKEKVMRIFEDAGFCEVYSKKDLNGNDRIVIGKWR